MVRALAGDSTMTRFFDTAGSVAPGPARTLTRHGQRWHRSAAGAPEVARRGPASPGRRPRGVRPRGCAGGSPRRSRGCRRRAILVVAPAGTATATRRLDRDLELRADRASAAGSRRSGCAGTGRRTRRSMSSMKTGRLPSSVRMFVQRRPRSTAVGQLEQVDEDRLLVVEVEDGIADHGRMVRRRGAPWSGPMVPV